MSTYTGTSASELIRGTQDGDTINGNGGNDTIVGGQDSLDGADFIQTLEGNDLIFGNGGADTITSGAGNDTVVAGMGNDLALGNPGDDLIYGNEGNDTVYGGMGNDTIWAGKNDDIVFGGEGNDYMMSGEGNNLLSGGNGIDVAVLLGGQGSYTFTRANGYLYAIGQEGVQQITTDTEYLSFGNDPTSAQVDASTLGNPTTVVVNNPVPTPTDAKFNNANAEVGPNGLKPDGTQPSGTGNANEPFHVTELHGGGVNDLQLGVNTHIRQANNAHLYGEGFLQGDGSVNSRQYGGPQISNGGQYSQSDSPTNAGFVIDVFGSADASNLITGGKTWNDYDAKIDVKLTLNDGSVTNQTLLLSHADATGNYTPFAAQGGFAGGLDDGAPTDPKTFNDSLNLKFFDTNALLAGTQAPDLTKLPGGSVDLTLSVFDRNGTTALLTNVNHIDLFAANSPQIAFA